MDKPLVVVTGASSGIGAATAIAFSHQGHPLLLLARRLERLKALNLPKTLCERVDVTERNSFTNAIKQAEDRYGPVDCLVNNAGVMLLGTTHEQAIDEWQTMFDVNVMGILNGIHIVLKSMVARQSGTIINISSIAGRKTIPNHAIYCGTKFAVHAIAEGIREEVAKSQVRVTTIAPGIVETELLSHTHSEQIKADYTNYKKSINGGLEPKTIAQTILFVYNQPQHVCIREVVLAPTQQEP